MLRGMFLLLAVALWAQEQPVHVEPPVHVTAIELVVDVRDATGKVPAGLTPDDFVLLEDGVERKVIGIDYLRKPTVAAPVISEKPSAPPPELSEWQILLYFDQYLSNATSRIQAAEALIGQVDELVRAGRVDVVVASPEPAALLRDSRDPKAVTAALQEVIKRNGTNWIARQREEFYRTKLFEATLSSVTAGSVRPYIEEEILLIRQFRSNLTQWLSRYGRHVPRALFIVTDGFDIDPLDFYSASLGRGAKVELRTQVDQSALPDSMDRLAQTIAAGGWTTFGVLGHPPMGGINDAATSGVGRVRGFASAARPTSGPKSLLYAPQQPLQIMSDATGGAVVANLSRLDDALKGLDERILLTYQVSRPPDGKVRSVTIRPRVPTLTVRSVQWSASSTPNDIAAARALDVMVHGSTYNDLSVNASFDWQKDEERKGTLRLSVPVDVLKPALPDRNAASFLLTFAIQVAPKRAMMIHRQVVDADIAAGVFNYQLRLDLPPEASAIVVEVEEASSGMWGTSRVALQR